MTSPTTVESIFEYGVAEVINADSLKKRLTAGQPLTVKFGVDPTSPDLHLGHAIALHKLRQFQELGHKTILLIGDFTTKIGDPSGRNSTRPVLSDAQIKANMQTYIDQAQLIIDPKKTKIQFNSEWLSKKSYADIIQVAMQISTQTLLEREDFAARLKNNQSLAFHELFYPLTQALDSVEMKADVELGGWDQRLNLLMGRELQKKMGQEPQEIVVMKGLVGLDGERKMSKSYGNYVGLTDSPDQMFGKLMSIPDTLIDQYAELAALMSKATIADLPKHPRDRKATVAETIVGLYHGAENAKAAAEQFQKTFSQKQGGQQLADEIRIHGSTATLVEAIKHAAGTSASEAQRLITQGGVRLNGEVVTDPNLAIDVKERAYQLQIGKHRFYELIKED